jgi:hypothetical protein
MPDIRGVGEFFPIKLSWPFDLLYFHLLIARNKISCKYDLSRYLQQRFREGDTLATYFDINSALIYSPDTI